MKVISNSSFGIGDAIHGLYAAQAYKNKYPNEEVVYASRQSHWFIDVKNITFVPFTNQLESDIHRDYNNKLRSAISCKKWYTDNVELGLLPIAPKLNTYYKGGNGYIVLAPHASHSNRNWSNNYWVQLEKKIRTELNLETIIIGTSTYLEEKRKVKYDYSHFKGKVLINKSPTEVRDILLNCNLLVSSESGMAHFAAMYNVPTLAIITQLRANYLYDFTDVIAITSTRVCNGCHFQSDRGYQYSCNRICFALDDIPVDLVFEKVVCFYDYKERLNEVFHNHLHREIDKFSLDTLLREYREGRTISQIERNIISSEEYNRHTKKVPFDSNVEVTMNMGVQEADGIGKTGLRYYIELKKLGVNCSPIVDVLIPDNLKVSTYNELINNNYKLVGRSYIATGCSGLIPQPLPEFAKQEGVTSFRYSMFEADRIPKEWITAYNNEETAAVIVPDEWVKQIFIDSGITKPVEVVTLGCDLKAVNKFKDDGVFTFGITSQFEERKNHLLTIQAFKLAFEGRTDVRLKVHGRWGHLSEMLRFACKDDSRIEFVDYCLPNLMYQEWWESLDAYIIPSSGEGFGFTPREALMRGIPTIVSDCTAHQKLVKAKIVLPIRTNGMKDAYKAIFNRVIGRDYIIEIEDIAKAMVYVTTNHEYEKKRALKGRKWLIENESWKEAANQLLNVVNKYQEVLV